MHDAMQTIWSAQLDKANLLERLKSIEIGDLTAFVVVAQIGSIRKSTGRLKAGQSSVSRKILKLEDALGVSLFERQSTGVRLTRVGHFIFERYIGLIDEFVFAAAQADAAATSDNGTLRIGFLVSLSAGPGRNLIHEFSRNQPKVNVLFSEKSAASLHMEMSERMIDVAIICGAIDPEGYERLRLAQERIFVALSATHRLAGRDFLHWQDLVGEKFVVSNSGSGSGISEHLIRRVSAVGSQVEIDRFSIERDSVMGLVGLGFGLSLAADSWTGTKFSGVEFIAIDDEENMIDVSVCWRPENDNPALRRFISLAQIEAKKNGVPS